MTMAGTKATAAVTDRRAVGPPGTSSARLVDVDRWHRWLLGRRGVDAWRRWSQEHQTLEGWSPAELLWPHGSERTDGMQAALVALSQDGEGDAAHLLLVQLRPGLTRLTRWAAGTGRWPWEESTDEVRATFFETLYRHRLDRRPHKIAANLILDTKQRLHRSRPGPTPGLRPTGDGRGTAADTETLDALATGHPDPTSDLAVRTTILAAVGRLPGSPSSRELTATVAYRAWILDQPRSTIAADLGLRSGTVAVRLHRLRALVDRRDLVG